MVLSSLSVACLYQKSLCKPVSQVQSFPYNGETKNIHREFTFVREDMYFHKKIQTIKYIVWRLRPFALAWIWPFIPLKIIMAISILNCTVWLLWFDTDWMTVIHKPIKMKQIKKSIWKLRIQQMQIFLVACTRLYKPLYRSVRWSVSPSHFIFFCKVAYRVACAWLMAIGLVLKKASK